MVRTDVVQRHKARRNDVAADQNLVDRQAKRAAVVEEAKLVHSVGEILGRGGLDLHLRETPGGTLVVDGHGRPTGRLADPPRAES